MKIIAAFLLIISANFIAISCFADEGAIYGTVEQPQINGVSYDVHKTYLEPNQGYQPKSTITLAYNAQVENKHTQLVEYKSQAKDKVNTIDRIGKVNFKSDSWASDIRIEKALKNAASEGKLNYVLNEAKKANLPASVAVVPIVESNYNKNAVSSKGAGGAWQLMPLTANDYGLSSKDRFNFESSTKTAIQLLNDLHQEFGNWALAFAAYNCGSRCVKTALNKNPEASDIDALSLPGETKDYVHKIVQLNQIIAGLDEKTIN